MSDTRFQINAPAVVAEEVDGEVIAINLSTGAYYSMQGWSAWVWSGLAGGAPVSALAPAIPSPDALAPFVEALVNDRLLVPVDAGSVPADETNGEVATPPTEPFTGLLLERHTDMADLILLDPVHDIDPDEGWPRVATDHQ